MEILSATMWTRPRGQSAAQGTHKVPHRQLGSLQVHNIMQLPVNKHASKSGSIMGPGPPSPPPGPGPGPGGPWAPVAAVSLGQLGATWQYLKCIPCGACKLSWGQWESCSPEHYAATRSCKVREVVFRNHENCERVRSP